MNQRSRRWQQTLNGDLTLLFNPNAWFTNAGRLYSILHTSAKRNFLGKRLVLPAQTRISRANDKWSYGGSGGLRNGVREQPEALAAD
jgi:hypothetical protein